jgi:hypothetical protein
MKIVNTTFLFLFIFCASFGQSIQSRKWDKLAGPYGGRISDIDYHASTGKFFAIGGQTLTPYVSTTGLSWTKLDMTGLPTNDRPYEFFIDNTDIYLIFYDGYLAKSTDGGNSFTVLNSSSKFISGHKMAKSADGLFILGSNNSGTSALWRSQDNGVSWSITNTASTGEKFDDILVNDANQIFISTAPGDASIYRSDNGGVSFTKKMTGITVGDQINSFVKSPNGASLFTLTQNKIYQTVNDGDTWTAVTTTNLASPGSNYGLLFCPTNTLLYFINNNNNDIHSIALTGTSPVTTGSWSIAPASFATDVTCVAAVSSTSFYMGQSYNGISRTTSCCGSFAEVSTGIEELRMSDVQIASNGNILVASEAGLHLSVDGSSWSKPNIGTTSLYNGRILHNRSNGELYLYGTGNGFAMKSTTDGASWVAHTAPPDNGIYYYETINGDKLFGISQGKIHYSSNSGAAWQTGAGLTITGAVPASYNIDDFDMDASLNLYAKIYNITNNRTEILKITLSPNPTSGTPITAVASRIDNTSGFSITQLENKSFEGNGSSIFALGRNAANKYVVNFSSNSGTSWSSIDATGGFYMFVGGVGNIL